MPKKRSRKTAVALPSPKEDPTPQPDEQEEPKKDPTPQPEEKEEPKKDQTPQPEETSPPILQDHISHSANEDELEAVLRGFGQYILTSLTYIYCLYKTQQHLNKKRGFTFVHPYFAKEAALIPNHKDHKVQWIERFAESFSLRSELERRVFGGCGIIITHLRISMNEVGIFVVIVIDGVTYDALVPHDLFVKIRDLSFHDHTKVVVFSHCKHSEN